MARPLRYTFILVLAALATALAAVGGWRYARASAPVNGPIILISIDTLRVDHLPTYGYRHVNTPAIDALAADGVVFERAYAHAPQTLPSHVAMLSGRLPFETGVRDNAGFSVKTSERLLPQLLHDRGYTTGAVVSSFLLRKETGISQGFDFFDGEMPPGAGTVRRDGGDSEAIAERWLDEQRSSRVFLFLHLYEPHAPYVRPTQFAHYAPYDSTIAYADDIVGRLMRYLKAHQLYDRSTIVLVSDHGEGLGDHGEQAHGLFLYDETIHVPLIVKQAAGVGAGRRVADVVQHIDLVPTILELVKAPDPGNLRGRSLKPLLDDTGELPEVAVYSEALYGHYHFGSSELTAATDARYRYIRAPHEELYDLQRDPQERENLMRSDRHETRSERYEMRSDRHERSRQALGSALDRLVAGSKAQPPAPIAAEDRERLHALGYVSASPDEPAAVAEKASPDPKDKRQVVEAYRSAVALGADRKWDQALTLLQGLIREAPEMAEAWSQIAAFSMSVNRYEQAADAYKHTIALRPSDPEGYLGSASALLKLHRLAEARDAAELVPRVAGDDDIRSRAAAHALLATIALARRDADGAREEAELAQAADPSMPMPDCIEARLLYDQGQYSEALPFFEEAIAAVKQSHAAPIADLHFYAADTLARLERYWDAEGQYLEEMRDFPQNLRARVGLAMLYQAMDRLDEAGVVVTDIVRVSPTPDSYALAARLWKTLGDQRQAEAVRTEAHRTFAEVPPRAAHESGKR